MDATNTELAGNQYLVHPYTVYVHKSFLLKLAGKQFQ
jgi:hypothetical protein